MDKTFKLGVVTVSAALVTLLLVGAVLGQSTPPVSNDPYRHLNVFTEVFGKIKSDYVEEPEMKNVTLGAINGLLVSVDPFASYLNSDQYKQYLKTKETEKAGVGLVLSRKYGYEINVVDAIPGSPSDKAGLGTGDIVEAINGISTRDMPLAYADVLLHGEPGSTVDITVMRMSKPEPTTLKLTREPVQFPAVVAKILEPGVGYLAVVDLRTGKTKDVAAAVKSLEKQGMKKLVLDLRHAAVSSPEEGVALANLFLSKGTIATLKGQKLQEQKFEADPAKAIFTGPMVVLTNRGTTGAAEITAAALQDNKRAEVVGERTYGDAAMRKAIPTEDGGAVLLAVGRYYPPSGKGFQENPIVPTVLVSEAPDVVEEAADEAAPAAPPTPTRSPRVEKGQEDPILKKGVDVLNGNKPVQAQNQPADGAGSKLGPLNVPVRQ